MYGINFYLSRGKAAAAAPLAIHKRLASPRAISITEHFIITQFGNGKQMNAIINAPSRRNILFTFDQLTVVIRVGEKGMYTYIGAPM